jgi:hypothetical protein
MPRPTLALVAVAGLLLATFAAAVVLVGPPRVRLSESATEADHVTLYQNGLAFVELARSFASDGGETQLIFALPTSAVFDSVRIEGQGIEVRELRSALAADPLLSPGDDVRVLLEDGARYEGTLLSVESGQLVLAAGNGTVLLSAEKVVAVELPTRVPADAPPGTADLAALVNAPVGARVVTLTYLARGPGWTPTYSLDLDSERLAFQATLTGLADWANVSLDLVAGSPNIVATPFPSGDGYDYRVAAGKEAAASPFAGGGGSGFTPSTPLGDLHRYHLQRPVSLHRGEAMRLPVLDGDLDVMKHYYNMDAGLGWGGPAGQEQRADVLERIEVRNTLTEPLPPGVVRFYRNDTWVGEDNLPNLAKGDRTNLTLARASEVVGRVTLESLQSTPTSDRYSYVLHIQNLGAATIDVRIAANWGSYRTNLLDAQPKPQEQYGSSAAWVAHLERGASAEFRVSYEQLRY